MDIEIIGLISVAGACAAAAVLGMRQKPAVEPAPITLFTSSVVTEPHEHRAGSCDSTGWFCDFEDFNHNVCKVHKHVPELPIPNENVMKKCRCGIQIKEKSWV